MSLGSRTLTKSRFKLALECPTKLYYTRKPNEYKDKSGEDEFLKALGRSGTQVGELAKYYFPGGTDIKTLDPEKALQQTQALLNQDNVIIYEAAIQFQNLLIRVDVLVKKGNQIDLIEVKSKSYDSVDEFYRKDGQIIKDWKPYFFDVAFQTHVMRNAFPQYIINPYLMLVDKKTVASVDGLNQRFLLREDQNGRAQVITRDTDDLGTPILTAENVETAVDLMLQEKHQIGEQEYDFGEYVNFLSEQYAADQRILHKVSSECRHCAFRLDQPVEDGLKSGFHECWALMANMNESDHDRPTVLDIWSNGTLKKQLDNGQYFQDQLSIDDLGKIDAQYEKPGLQSIERKELQILASKRELAEVYIDKEGLRSAMEKAYYPLNFIDFETSMVAIPFFKGQRPYQTVAFQFSHHILYQDGRVDHATEWINREVGKFPNFDFVRALKKALDTNDGSVFRYSYHENTVLCKIHTQLEHSQETDRVELMRWIETITSKPNGKSGKKKGWIWKGPRNMIDQWDLVKKFCFDPATKGSNSIKAILPSALSNSAFLQEKYSKPIYGSEEIKSLNFENQIWLKYENGEILSPYQQLPPLFDKYTRDQLDLLQSNDELDDGGAAMTAYNMMQFTEMGDTERKKTIEALLRYCELDTLAMVMIWEYWREAINPT